MSIVTGVLADIARGALSAGGVEVYPEIWAFPRNAYTGNSVVSPSGIIATRPTRALPAMSTGVFQFDLQPTDTMRPETWYELMIQWLDADGKPRGQDWLPFRLYVPPAGGTIADLLLAPWNPTLAWWGPEPPEGPPVAGTLWLDSDSPTGDLYVWVD